MYRVKGLYKEIKVMLYGYDDGVEMIVNFKLWVIEEFLWSFCLEIGCKKYILKDRKVWNGGIFEVESRF